MRKTPGISRRDFLRVTSTLTASAAMVTTGCQMPVEHTVPFHERPEGLRTPGRPKQYATVLDGVPVLVKSREGRPILVSPYPGHPAAASPSVRTWAAILDLYDPDRAQGPLSVRRSQGAPTASDWQTVGAELASRLKKSPGRVALLTGPLSGPATREVIAAWTAAGATHVEWSPLAAGSRAAAWRRCFGETGLAWPDLGAASLVVGLGAEFLDRPERGQPERWASRRDPDHPEGMSRFVAFESRLSLTGANADRRYRVRDSQLPLVALALARTLYHELGVEAVRRHPAIEAALAPYTVEAVAGATGLAAEVLRGVAAELHRAGPGAVVLAGESVAATAEGEALHVAVNLLNWALGAQEALCQYDAAPPAGGGLAALGQLAADLKAGRYEALVVAGANPVYDAPAALGFAEALAGVPFFVSLADRVDETARHADYLAPASHPLEAWGDATLAGGIAAIQQPVLRPLYDTHGLLDALVAWGAAAGWGEGLAQAAAAAKPAVEGAAGTSPAWHYLRELWWPGRGGDPASWEDLLREGYVAGREVVTVKGFQPEALAKLPPVQAASGLELQLFPHYAHHDGRAGNNGWLHEFPDPLTRSTWGGWAAIAPRRFDEMGLKNGDLVTLTVGGESVTLPAYRQAGMHYEAVAAPLGLGRRAVGKVGDDIGRNLFPLRGVAGDRAIGAGLAVTLAKAAGKAPLAITQGAEVLDRKPRPLVPTATLDEYRADPRAGTEQIPGGPSIWPEYPYEKQRWVMAIDLSKCNGCGQCTVACQAENNIPVVGRQGVIEGREMSWIRIDRYYDAPAKEGGWDDEVWDGPLEVVEEPTTFFEPMLCQHCENAPCETVCPFVATMHSEDGLNQQIYNRCVGTRYCANNCPFKVRRFNWFEYSRDHRHWFFSLLVPRLERHYELNARGRMQMKNNPEVTVRSRGVMEKCSFCVQRIREARAEATREGRPGQLPDGSVLPACGEVCPTGAIVFGDLNDPNSRVSALARGPRAMRLLELTGVKPSVVYLTKVRHV